MDDLHALKCLVAAIDTGSLSGAARRLGVSQPAVSQKLRSFETEIGQPLVMRSRNGVAPTPAGEIAYRHGREILSRLVEMQAELDEIKGEATGRLRVTSNVLFGQTVMGEVVMELRKRHPGLKIEPILTDKTLDLQSEGIDIAIRFLSPGSGEGITRRIGALDGVLVATPDYLNAVGRPKRPEELAGLSYVQYRDDPNEAEIRLIKDGHMVMAPVNPSYTGQHPNLVLQAVLSGLGFAITPQFFVRDALESGALERVLPDYAPPPKPIYLVQMAHVRNSARSRAFQEALFDRLGQIEGVQLVGDTSAFTSAA